MTDPRWPEPDEWEQPQEEVARAAFNTDCLEQIRKFKRNPSMKMSETFQSKWLKAEDLKGRDAEVTINGCSMEQFVDGSQKPVLWFTGKDKGLVLNKTNGTAIAGKYGDDTESWKGQPIILFAMQVQGPNGPTQGIRVRFPDAPAMPAKAAAAAEDFDDDIPF